MNTLSEETSNVPNYLIASTGSCRHDFCKYGKHHEHVKSAIPRKFKQTIVVDKEKVAKTVVPVTTTVATVNPSADPKIPKLAENVALPSKNIQVMRRSLSTNGKAMGNEAAKNNVILPSQKAQIMKQTLSTHGKAMWNDSKNGPQSVVLNKLPESRKSKVKALVGAFETVISACKPAESRKTKVKALVDAFETKISACKPADNFSKFEVNENYQKIF
ncbi:putative calmodulin-binding domain containing protein [Tanacetum coccineum]